MGDLRAAGHRASVVMSVGRCRQGTRRSDGISGTLEHGFGQRRGGAGKSRKGRRMELAEYFLSSTVFVTMHCLAYGSAVDATTEP